MGCRQTYGLMEEGDLSGARSSLQDRISRRHGKGDRSSRRGGFRGRRTSRKRGNRQTKKTSSRDSLQPCYSGEDQPGESSGYASGSGISVSGDEIGEHAICSRICTLPPIACSPTPETRTRTASPLTPVKLTPMHSGRSIRGRHPSCLTLSTSTASSGDSAVVLDYSAVSSWTSMRSSGRDGGDSPAASARTRGTGVHGSHLEPPPIGRLQRRQSNRNTTKLDPLETTSPMTYVNSTQPSSNLYLSDTYSNLNKRELFFQFRPPVPLDNSSVGQSTSVLPPQPCTRKPVLPPVGHSRVGHPVTQVLHETQNSGREQGGLPAIHMCPAPGFLSSSTTWKNNCPRPPQTLSQSTDGVLGMLRGTTATLNPNLRVVGGSALSISLDQGLHRAPLPSIGATPQPLGSSSNLYLCRSHQGSSVDIQVQDGTHQMSEQQVLQAEATDSHAPLPQITKRYYGTNSSSGSSTPNSSLLDLAKLADGTIPQINLIAPTPCPSTPVPPRPNSKM